MSRQCHAIKQQSTRSERTLIEMTIEVISTKLLEKICLSICFAGEKLLAMQNSRRTVDARIPATAVLDDGAARFV